MNAYTSKAKMAENSSTKPPVKLGEGNIPRNGSRSGEDVSYTH
jgi:hypothetical protein